MNPNIFQPLSVLDADEIRQILVRRIDRQKQAVGIVVGVIEPNGRRVVAYGALANGDSRTLDGDTIFEIGSISKVFTSLLLADNPPGANNTPSPHNAPHNPPPSCSLGRLGGLSCYNRR